MSRLTAENPGASVAATGELPTLRCCDSLWRWLTESNAPSAFRAADGMSSKLAAWSARDVETDAGAMVVAVEEFTGLIVVFPRADLSTLRGNFAAATLIALMDMGMPPAIAAAEALAIANGCVVTRGNRETARPMRTVATGVRWQLEGAHHADFDAIRLAQRNLNDCRCPTSRVVASPPVLYRLLASGTALH